MRGGGETSPAVSAFSRAFHHHYPNAKIILLVGRDNDLCADQLLTKSIAGCLFQEELSTALVHLIRAVAAGETFFSRAVVAQLVGTAPRVNLDGTAFGLTEREREVLMLIVQGYANHEIAATLCLSPQTVRNKASRIYSKIGVGSRAALLAWAR